MDGTGVITHVDWDRYDFHVRARPGAKPEDIRLALAKMRSQGFEPLPEDECPADIAPDGRIRVYFVPTADEEEFP